MVRKRAIVTLSQFIPISEPSLFNDLVFAHVIPYLVPAASIEKQRTTVHLIAAVARHSPIQLAPILDQIIPAILKAVQRDDDELREGALQVRIFPRDFECVGEQTNPGSRGNSIALPSGSRLLP